MVIKEIDEKGPLNTRARIMNEFAKLIENSPALPAPMCGISCRATRQIAREHGAGLVYTQMASIEALIRNDDKTLRLIDVAGEQAPVVVQVFGSRPEAMGEAVRMIEDMGAAAVDFNMGCPARKVTENRSGAALLNEPDLVRRMVASAVSALTIPFTVKTRWNWDDEGSAAPEIARICQEEGAQAVCLHARTRSAKFSGQADWSRIAELKSTLSIPVIGNGDITSGADALAMREATGCDAVMAGRALIGAPWVLSDCLRALSDGQPPESSNPTGPQRLEIMRRHARYMAERIGEERGLKEFRKHAVAYLKGIPGARAIRTEMMKIHTLDELDQVLRENRLAEVA